MISRTRHAFAYSRQSSFRCSVILVPCSARSPAATVNVPAPVERQSTASAPGCIDRVSTSTRSATMNAA